MNQIKNFVKHSLLIIIMGLVSVTSIIIGMRFDDVIIRCGHILVAILFALLCYNCYEDYLDHDLFKSTQTTKEKMITSIICMIISICLVIHSIKMFNVVSDWIDLTYYGSLIAFAVGWIFNSIRHAIDNFVNRKKEILLLKGY